MHTPEQGHDAWSSTRHQPASHGVERRRLLVIAPALPPARVAEADHVLHECLRLAEHGFDVHVVTTREEEIAAPPSIVVHDVVSDWSWRQLPVLVRHVRTVRPDAVLLYFLGTLFRYSTMVLFLPGLLRVLCPGMRVVTQFSNLGTGAPKDGTVRSAGKRWLFWALGPLRLGTILPLSHDLVVLSGTAAATLQSFPFCGHLARRVHVIPPPPLLPMAEDREAARHRRRAELEVLPEETVVAFFGRLHQSKGVEALVEAIARLRATGRPVRGLLIGGYMSAERFYWTVDASYEERLARVLRAHDAESFITLTGEYDWDSTAGSEYLCASDLVVLPLHAGVSLSNSSLAASCAHGRPVVVNRSHPPEGAIRHRVNAYVLDDASPESIAAAVAEILDDEVLRQRLTHGSQTLADRCFDWQAATRRLGDLLGRPEGP